MSEPSAGGGDVVEGRRDEPGETAPASSTDRASGARPLVLPEVFDGTGSWSDWCFHFDNVAAVNGWDEAQKLQWLRVRVTGRAQKALLRLPAVTAASFDSTREALRTRFEPESRQTRYQAEFQLRRKKAAEGWADLADALRTLADKAYPTLQEEARERLAINAYLDQLPQPQLSFAVRQKQPDTLDDAVATTLEMESYLPAQGASAVDLSLTDDPRVTVQAVDKVTQLTQVVDKLVEKMEQLQLQMADRGRPPTPGESQMGSRRRQRRGFGGECWNCRQRGHLARNCPLPQQQNRDQSGN